MLVYCPGSGQELLSAFGVTMECQDSSVFLIRKLPLSITEALLKSMEWSWDHAWFTILEPLAAVFTFLKCSFIRVLNALTIPAHSLGNTTFFLHTFIINLHSPFFFILTHLYSYFIIHFYPLKTVDQSLYFFKYF